MTCETAQNAFQLRNSRLLYRAILFGPHVEELCEGFGCSVHVAQCFMCQTAHRKSIKAWTQITPKLIASNGMVQMHWN